MPLFVVIGVKSRCI